MTDADLHLDGNAAAGLLSEIFSLDVTSAEAACSGCGARGNVASLITYAHAMGAVLRCPSCDAAVIRVLRTDHGYWLDFRGAGVLHVSARA